MLLSYHIHIWEHPNYQILQRQHSIMTNELSIEQMHAARWHKHVHLT